ELRISATVGLAIDRLANPKAKSIALIGSGRLAMPILEPAAAVRSVERISVYSRNPSNRESFARAVSEKLKVAVKAIASPETAISQADLVLVSTNSPVPALMGKWLRPGLSVFGVGRPNEFDDDVYLRADLISVTSKVHELGYYDTQLDQPLIRLSQHSKVSWNDVVEFGDIVAEKANVPELSKSIVVFRDSQGGYGDLALAAWVYEEARRRGLGREISTE
ncbi:MAG TPA: NAD(P)-binding domain-containing protein, partial [Candidatus Acidoferrales bacterium]|nr:NAD(P)-binding domain-containing protein [Candidatus Acidoferrales bacterium]